MTGPLTSPPPGRAAVVAHLRAAGCVYAEEEADLLLQAADTGAELGRLLARRIDGEPLEQVLGWASFCGLQLRVVPGVFVPRRRTGLLVREASALLGRGAVVVDLCCGCGAVAAALAGAVPGLELHAVDIDERATDCARRNLGDRGAVHEGDLFDPLPVRLAGRVEVVVSSPPYVPTEELALLPREARLHEPRPALDGGPDGLTVHRRVLAGVGSWLAPEGHVLLECGEDQLPALAEVVTGSGLTARPVHDEETGGCVVVGSRTPPHRGRA